MQRFTMGYLSLEIAGLKTKTYPEDSLPAEMQHGWRAGEAPTLPKGPLELYPREDVLHWLSCVV